MNSEISAGVINGIVVDQLLINDWPSNFSGCWIAITKYSDGSTNASLIKNNLYPEQSIVYTNELKDMISSIKWNKFYRFIAIYTVEEYRNNGVAYDLARWSRTWVAKNEAIKISMPFISERVPETQNFIDHWEANYEGASTKIQNII